MHSFAFWLKVANLVLQVVLSALLIYDWWHFDDPRRASKGIGLVLGGLLCLGFAIYLVTTHSGGDS